MAAAARVREAAAMAAGVRVREAAAMAAGVRAAVTVGSSNSWP